MVSLTPPVTSEIIFFISRWVLGTPSFSIILFKDIRSAGGKADILSVETGVVGVGGEWGSGYSALWTPHPEDAWPDSPSLEAAVNGLAPLRRMSLSHCPVPLGGSVTSG